MIHPQPRSGTQPYVGWDTRCPFGLFPLPGLAYAGTAATNSAMTTATDATSALSDRVANKSLPPTREIGLREVSERRRGRANQRPSFKCPKQPSRSVPSGRGLAQRLPANGGPGCPLRVPGPLRVSLVTG